MIKKNITIKIILHVAFVIYIIIAVPRLNAAESKDQARKSDYFVSLTKESHALLILKSNGEAVYSQYNSQSNDNSVLIFDSAAKWKTAPKNTGLLGFSGCDRIFSVTTKRARFDYCQKGDQVQEIDKTGVQRTFKRAKNTIDD